MRRMNSKLALVDAVALVGSLFLTASADAISTGPLNVSTSIVNAFTNFETGVLPFTQTLSFPKFNPALGTLLSVKLDLTGTMLTDLKITALETGVSGGFAQANMYLKVWDATTSDLSHLSTANITTSVTTGGDSKTLAAGQSYNWYNLSASAGSSNTYTLSQVLSEFTNMGNGSQMFLHVKTTTQTLVGWDGGNATASQVTKGSVTGTVTYQYSAVPEAATLLLSGLAAMPILMQRRRQRGVDASAC